MAAVKKQVTPKRPASKKVVPSKVPAPAELKAFHHATSRTENFGFSRFWWEGDGPRDGIAPKVLKKFQPLAGPDDDPETITAARTDLLLPLDAQADYMDVHHLLNRYDAKLPTHEKHAFVQVTLHFPDALNLHSAWEEARAFAMRYLVTERRLAVILVLHAPNLAASGSHLHAHLLAPLRRLGPLGWGEVERKLPNDRGFEEVREAWWAFRREWDKQSREGHGT